MTPYDDIFPLTSANLRGANPNCAELGATRHRGDRVAALPPKDSGPAVKLYSPKRLLWLSLGLACLGLGTIGIFLPLLPTTSFLLVAAFAFARSSPRLHNWLLRHKVFGPIITDWQAHGAIGIKAKRTSLISMIAIVGLSFILKLPLWVIALQIAVLCLVSLFLWTRPNPPR